MDSTLESTLELEQQASLLIKAQVKAQAAGARAPASGAPWSETLPDIKTTLQMAELAKIVYEDDCVKLHKEMHRQRLKDELKKEGDDNTEMWFYEAAGDTEAAVTFSPENKRCTVIFRGTESFSDMWADLMLSKTRLSNSDDPDDLTDPSNYPDCLVHAGFRSQYYGQVTAFKDDGHVADALRDVDPDHTVVGKVLETALFEKVKKVLEAAPETDLCVTGHSLGGALSVLFGIRLALELGPLRKVQVINFGCPKVGNAAFAELVKTTGNLCVQRVAHGHDIVTRVPNFGLGYEHVGHTIQVRGDLEPCAFKWHSGLDNWSLLRGSLSDHKMAGYIEALSSSSHGAKNAAVKPWVTSYTNPKEEQHCFSRCLPASSTKKK